MKHTRRIGEHIENQLLEDAIKSSFVDCLCATPRSHVGSSISSGRPCVESRSIGTHSWRDYCFMNTVACPCFLFFFRPQAPSCEVRGER